MCVCVSVCTWAYAHNSFIRMKERFNGQLWNPTSPTNPITADSSYWSDFRLALTYSTEKDSQTWTNHRWKKYQWDVLLCSGQAITSLCRCRGGRGGWYVPVQRSVPQESPHLGCATIDSHEDGFVQGKDCATPEGQPKTCAHHQWQHFLHRLICVFLLNKYLYQPLLE